MISSPIFSQPTPPLKVSLAPKELCDKVVTILDQHKAMDIKVIELKGKSAIADYFVVANGTTARHTCALANHIEETLKKEGIKPLSIEGVPQGDWVLIDLADVIVHLFRPEIREFYGLEKMWAI